MALELLLDAWCEAHLLGLTHLDGGTLEPDAVIYPQLRVVPMGWSWGVSMIQEAHLFTLSGEEGLSDDRHARDFRPPPGLGSGPAFSLYIDNLCVVGTTAASVDSVLRRGVQAWEQAGLGVHEVEWASLSASNLGGEQGGTPSSNGISKKRADILYAAIGWLLDVRCKCTSAELGHMVGHLSFASLFKRESLSLSTGRSTISSRRSSLCPQRFGQVCGGSCISLVVYFVS